MMHARNKRGEEGKERKKINHWILIPLRISLFFFPLFSTFMMQTPNAFHALLILLLSKLIISVSSLSTMSESNTFFAATKAAGTTVEFDFGDKTAPKKHAIAYWSIRGLGAPLTMMLCAAKTPFTLFLYDILESGQDGWTSDYFAAKKEYMQEYKQPLWNLPFCVDRENQKIICQTNAIFAHLGRACGMMGDDEVSASECEQLLCEIYDLRDGMIRFVYGPDPCEPAELLDSAGKYLTKLEAWLELQAEKEVSVDHQDKKVKKDVVHLVNGKFSAPDFHLYEMLDQYEALAKEHGQDLYQGFERLRAFKEGFAALPENEFYLNSWLHTELPFNNCMGRFGSLPGPKTYVHGESAKDATWRGKGVVEMSCPK